MKKTYGGNYERLVAIKIMIPIISFGLIRTLRRLKPKAMRTHARTSCDSECVSGFA